MGRASSSKKVARAAKASGRPGTTSNFLWPAVIGVIVVLGIGLVAISAVGRESNATAAPILGDHWHAAYGVYVCDTFLPSLSDAGADLTGVHTHDDGLIHIHPYSTRYTGPDANLRAFGETVALQLDDESLTLPTGETHTNGDDCDGEPGVVQVKVWSDITDPEGELLESDFADYAPQDGELVTIAFAPEGTELAMPPSAGTQPTDIVPAPGETVPPGVPSTLPADDIVPEDEPGTDEPGADEGAGDTTATTAP